MKLKYEAPKGGRIKNHGFTGVQCYPEKGQVDLCFEDGKWIPCNEAKDGIPTSNTEGNVRSVKAFKRRLKNKYPKGYTWRLYSRWIGFNVDGRS